MEPKTAKNECFNAEAFVQNLLDEGTKYPCDETTKSFNDNGNLPPFYDETLYKRGQKFFMDNIFALFYGKFLGLISVLAIPSILRVLIYTKMSGSPLTAYKRYLATIFHMCIWYQKDFTPGSKIWQSIMQVKGKHNSVSKRSCSAGFGRISQKDMALTQFGFMGYALAKREKIGLYNVDDGDLRGFVHVWRVVGFIMGIEDRFNICRDSVEETSAICRVLAEQVFLPAFERRDKDFIQMATHLTNGMWSMNPNLNAKVCLNLAYKLLRTPNNNNSEKRGMFIKLTFSQKILLYLMVNTMWCLRYKVCKLFHNYTQYMALWLMKVFPFLGYYQFGYANSHIRVLEDDVKSN